MSEEDMNAEYDSTEETETSAPAYGDENNTSNGSETESTQGNGRTAQERIRQLIAENKKLKGQVTTADKPSSATQAIPEDKMWKAKVEARLAAPEHLKDQAEDMAFYSAQYGIPMEDVITLFDAKNKVSTDDVAAMNAAHSEASQSRTGGTSNPAARIESSDDPAKWSDQELDAELQRRLDAGEKF